MITPRSKLLISQRTDYPWLLLATAVGIPEAVIQVTQALTREQLDRPMRYRLFGPPQTHEMVEALAAWDVTVLGQLAAEWVAPSSLNTKIGWCSLYAWMAALRHLERLGLVEYQDFQSSSFTELRDQSNRVWGMLPLLCLTWGEIRALPWLRSKYQYNFSETSLTPDDLNDTSDTQLAILRGHTEKLTNSARSALVDLSVSSIMALKKPEQWINIASGNRGNSNIMRCCLCIQLCDEVQVNIRPLLVECLDYFLPLVSEPEDVAPLVYVSLGKWYWP